MAGNVYASVQWRKVRLEVLLRDGHRCQIKGPSCTHTATEADHIIPVADGGAVYDPANLRAACKPCNIWRANRQKARDGWRRSATHVVLVVGPPDKGEDLSQYVAEHAGPHDMIVDYNAIAQAVGPSHEMVSKLRGHLLTQVRRGEVDAPRVWIVSTNPRAESLFPHHDVVTVGEGDQSSSESALVNDWHEARRATPRTSREW